MSKIVVIYALFLLLVFGKDCFGSDTYWIKGKLPPKSETDGDWSWDNDVSDSGIISHTYGAKEDLKVHSFATETLVRIDNNSRIIQYVFLAPKDAPGGIMVSYDVAGGGEDLTLYWEGDEEVFKGKYSKSWYMGPIPKVGEWVKLIIDCNELDVNELTLSGASFIASGGKAWWGRTVIEKD